MKLFTDTARYAAYYIITDTGMVLLSRMYYDYYYVLFWVIDLPQGSELAGWAEGRYSFEGIDLNHNFPDLNNIMWDAQEVAADASKVSNHYIPIPEYYTQEDAMVGDVAASQQWRCTQQWQHIVEKLRNVFIDLENS